MPAAGAGRQARCRGTLSHSSLHISYVILCRQTALRAATHLQQRQGRALDTAAHRAAENAARSWLPDPVRGSDAPMPPECCVHMRNSGQIAPDASWDQLESEALAPPSAGRTTVSEGLFYEWRYHSRVHYLQIGSEGPAVLLIHGFGVGGWQFKELMGEMGTVSSQQCRVWAVDLLGQGRSWPQQPPQPHHRLAFSVDTWTEQIADFIRDVVREPVFLVGNSLGGFVSASVAAQHSNLCRGVCFLNATPFWAFNPAATVAASEAATAAAAAVGVSAGSASRAALGASQQVLQSQHVSFASIDLQHAAQPAPSASVSASVSASDGPPEEGTSSDSTSASANGDSLPEHAAAPSHTGAADASASGLGASLLSESDFRPSLGWLPRLRLWDGALPAPPLALKLLDLIWAQLQHPDTIRRTLSQVYCDPALAEESVDDILEATREPLAPEAFASIICAPRSSMPFDQMLRRMQQAGIPVCMCYGREDPWVKPLWGQRLKRVCTEAQYYEVSPAGHCPHHEAPATVALVLSSWIQQVEHGGEGLLRVGDTRTLTDRGRQVELSRLDGSPRSCFGQLVAACWDLSRRLQSEEKR